MFESNDPHAGESNPSIPFYVTRMYDDRTYAWSVGAKQGMCIILLGQLALICWLFIAVVAALVLIVGTGIDVVGDIVDWIA